MAASGICMSSDRQYRLAIVQFGRMLYENGFVRLPMGICLSVSATTVCW